MQTIKLLLQNVLLWLLNHSYSPSSLGFYSENNGGDYVIMNKDRNKMRQLGSNQWQNWKENVSYPRVHNESLVEIQPEELSLRILWYIIRKETKYNSYIYLVSNFLKLEIVSVFMWVTAKLLSWVPISFWDLTKATLIIVCIFTLIDVFFGLVTKRGIPTE